MKMCRRCQQLLDFSSFNYKDKEKGTFQVYFKSCSREYVKEHYARNKPYYIQKARNRNKWERSDRQQRILDYLLAKSCVDCGETDPIVLDFDHIDKDTKFRAYSK